MDQGVQRKLQHANKLIFIRDYRGAQSVLDEILASPEGEDVMLVHLRRLELGGRLQELDRLRNGYLRALERREIKPAIGELCIYLAEQQASNLTPDDCVSKFQQHMHQYGESAAAYFGIAASLEAEKDFERAIFNYQQCLRVDLDWYPADFGLSQIHYQLDNDKMGDQYFYSFEQKAPYSLYGNFETHRSLSQEFLSEGKFDEAQGAIKMLSEWWAEQKGNCPLELQIFEQLAIGRIEQEKGDAVAAEIRFASGLRLVDQMLLSSPGADTGTLHFVAKALEEHGLIKEAFGCYKAILSNGEYNPELVQKIGSQMLALGRFEEACELFEEAYSRLPENSEIRFCRLVTRMKVAGVDIEGYLAAKERLRQLVVADGDKAEILAVLQNLVARYPNDSEVQEQFAQIYLHLGNVERAQKHYVRMYELDHASKAAALRYAKFLMGHGSHEDAWELLSKLEKTRGDGSEQDVEIAWMSACYYLQTEHHAKAAALLEHVLKVDPWNIAYLVQYVECLTALAAGDTVEDAELDKLSEDPEGKINWVRFEERTGELDRMHEYKISYNRRKLSYLFANGDPQRLFDLIDSAVRFDTKQGIFDLLRLLNTNFDGPEVYLALGSLFKELWQLETAGMWFEQVLKQANVGRKTRVSAMLELADCLIWIGATVPKAIEYLKMVSDMGEKGDELTLSLAHAHLKNGQVGQAKQYLDRLDKYNEYAEEAAYLEGLLHYRNGAKTRANQVWKKLLTVPAETRRSHHIKQEIFKYYFDRADYLQA